MEGGICTMWDFDRGNVYEYFIGVQAVLPLMWRRERGTHDSNTVQYSHIAPGVMRPVA